MLKTKQKDSWKCKDGICSEVMPGEAMEAGVNYYSTQAQCLKLCSDKGGPDDGPPNQLEEQLAEVLQACGLGGSFALEDFVKFASFYASSKAYGSSCSPSLLRDAELAYALGFGFLVNAVFDIEGISKEKDEVGGVLSPIGNCAILHKISTLIKKCCGHPDFNRVINEAEKRKKKKKEDRKFSEETINERLGLTKESDLKNQEHIRLDLSYVPHCSNIREMVPGNNNLANRVTGISHNGKNVALNRDNCLQSGKIWNTLNNTCYCIDEIQTPHIRFGDKKIRKELFHLGPPRSWVNVSGITELDLDEESEKRFGELIADKENIKLEDVLKTSCGEENGCIWYSCLIDGITNYFLGCKRNTKEDTVKPCYYNRNLLKSTTLSNEERKSILKSQAQSTKSCCEKCYKAGCDCNQDKTGDCNCMGISNTGTPCNQITARSIASLNALSDSDPVIKTDRFNSDSYVPTNETTNVQCCNKSMDCPPGMTDAECCEELCKDAKIGAVIRRFPNSIKRVRNNNSPTSKHLGGKCTCRKCGAQAYTASQQECHNWISTHKENCSGTGALPSDCNRKTHKNYSIPQLMDFTHQKDPVSQNQGGCCRGNKGGCCTCFYTSSRPEDRGLKISWPCCCNGSKAISKCCDSK